jgi:hypothetical protein
MLPTMAETSNTLIQEGLVSRAGLEPATTALKDRNGLIAGVQSLDFSDD